MVKEQNHARIVAEQDAKADVNLPIWFGIGLFLNIVGVLIACAYQPSAPVSRILGKSQQYVLFYDKIYRTRIRNLQTTYAVVGCIIPYPIVTLFFFLERIFI